MTDTPAPTVFPGLDENPVFELVDAPRRDVAGWTEGDVDVAPVYVHGSLVGYLWRGVTERALGFVRVSDDDEPLYADDLWTQRINQATQADRFTTAGFFAHWLGFDNGTTAVSDNVGRTTLATLMGSVSRS